MSASLFLALKYLSFRRLSSLKRILGAILAVGLSLVPLIVVIEVSDGMIQGITTRILEVGTYHLQISNIPAFPEQYSLVDALSQVPEISIVIPEKQGVGLIRTESGSMGVTIRAIPQDLWDRDEGFRRYLQILEGSFTLSDPRGMMIGADLANRLNIGVGDPVKLITPFSLTGDTILSRISRFTVAGIVSAGYLELDRLWVFISEERRHILSPNASRSIVGVKVEDPFGNLQPLVNTMYNFLPRSYRINTWEELDRSRFLSFKTTRFLLIFIMALILCVAAVNISSTLILFQIEKREDLAVMKSYGLSPTQIQTLFHLIGAAIGILGAALGTAIGVGVTVHINEIIYLLELLLNNSMELGRLVLNSIGLETHQAPIRILDPAFYLEQIPIALDLREVLAAGFFAVLLSVLASVIPARVAGRLKPLEVLVRH